MKIGNSPLRRPCPTVTKHEFSGETVTKLGSCVMNNLRRRMSGLETRNLTVGTGHRDEVYWRGGQYVEPLVFSDGGATCFISRQRHAEKPLTYGLLGICSDVAASVIYKADLLADCQPIHFRLERGCQLPKLEAGVRVPSPAP
jgi:hypothetical protein